MSLLPSDFIKHSMDAYIDTHTTKSQKIYWVVLAAVLAVIISLPFIYVDVSVQDRGVVRPLADKIQYQQNRLDDYQSHLKDLGYLL